MILTKKRYEAELQNAFEAGYTQCQSDARAKLVERRLERIEEKLGIGKRPMGFQVDEEKED